LEVGIPGSRDWKLGFRVPEIGSWDSGFQGLEARVPEHVNALEVSEQRSGPGSSQVDMKLPRKENSNSHGAKPGH